MSSTVAMAVAVSMRPTTSSGPVKGATKPSPRVMTPTSLGMVGEPSDQIICCVCMRVCMLCVYISGANET
jgi:hypothetical protein